MKIYKKVLIAVSITFFCFMLILYLVLSNFVLKSFSEIEKQNTIRNVESVKDTLSNEFFSLNRLIEDWASWDDTYEFIENRNEKYVKSNIQDLTFESLGVNLFLFVNSTNGVVFGRVYDLEEKKEKPFPVNLQEYFSNYSVLLQHNILEKESGDGLTGLVLFSNSSMLIASRPILTSNGEGPSRGTMIIGRYFNEREISKLANLTHLSLTIHYFEDPQLPEDFECR